MQIVTTSPAPTAIPHWPASERPRERLFNAGPAALSDSELLAIFVRTGIRACNAVQIGRNLITRFGSVYGTLNARHDALSAIPGLGPAKIAQLSAINEIMRRALAHEIRLKPALDNPGAIGRYLRLLIAARPHEVFVVLYLDNRLRLIEIRENARGTINETPVYPREIAREALELNASAIVIAHNHPSGDLTPSAADHRLTDALKTTLAMLDIRVLDHFVVSAHSALSFAERGWL